MSAPPLGPGGEFDLIRAFAAAWGDQAVGLGDDAAVLDLPPGERLMVSTDASVEGVHFRPDWITPEEIGWRATMAALSDLAAMGATPRGVLLALVVPGPWRDRAAGVARGVGEAARAADTVVVGGDVSRGDALVVGVTVLGSAARALTRDGARVGDRLWVTGALGGPAAALAAWTGGGAPAPADRERFARPVARIAAGRALAALGAHAAIDVSDGLVADATHLAVASGVALHLQLDRLPCVVGVDWVTAARSGEEYELLVAAPAGLDVGGVARAHGVPATHVGDVVPGAAGTVTVGPSAAPSVDALSGHDHFSP